MDRDLWEKIVLDLLSNAFKFIFDGSNRIETRYQIISWSSCSRYASRHDIT